MQLHFPPHITQRLKTAGKINSPSLPQIVQQSLAKYAQPQENFTTIISDPTLRPATTAVYRQFAPKKTFIHIGMGGSSLGPAMLTRTLSTPSDVQFYFLDNSDPTSVIPTLTQADLAQSLFYVVSKSGQTMETLAILSRVLERLQAAGIPPARWKEHLVFCTDPNQGELTKMAHELAITTLPFPPGVGGRFSVLTPAGLLPASFAHIDIDLLFRGAQEALELLPTSALQHLVQAILQGQGQISQTVLMPYCDRLKSFNAWFVQLWAESLGKDGTGLTPITAIGASDQHSQMQLFMDGPRDKFFIFIQIAPAPTNSTPPRPVPVTYLPDFEQIDLAQLLQCQLAGTLQAMDDQQLPYVLLTLPQLDARQLGKLIVFFELLTVCVGAGLGVNPFDQPGVERAKRYASQLLGAQAPKNQT